MEKTHLKVISLFIYDTLNLIIELFRFHDNIVFKDDCIFDTLTKTPLVKFHVTYETPDGTQIEIGNIGSLNIRIVVHFDCLFKIFGFHMFLKLPRDLYVSRVWTIDDFCWYIFIMTFEESFLSFLLVFDCQ